MTWLELINEASRNGYRVLFDADMPGWVVVTPKAPRRPPQELGAFHDEQRAWRAAAFLNSQNSKGQ